MSAVLGCNYIYVTSFYKVDKKIFLLFHLGHIPTSALHAASRWQPFDWTFVAGDVVLSEPCVRSLHPNCWNAGRSLLRAADGTTSSVLVALFRIQWWWFYVNHEQRLEWKQKIQWSSISNCKSACGCQPYNVFLLKSDKKQFYLVLVNI